MTSQPARAALAFLLVLLLAGPVHGHETDQFTLPEGRVFADIGPHLNEWAFNAIERGMLRTNQRIADSLRTSRGPSGLEQLQSPDTVIRAINSEFGNAYDVIEGLERRLHSRRLKEQYPGKIVGHKQQIGNIYQHVHFPLDPRQFFRIWHSTTFYAYGTYVGTDKIGHFTDMGLHYYRGFMAARANGASDSAAALEAVRIGTHGPIFSERGMVGFLSAGHYSNADLAANYLGMLFYRNLTEPVRIKGELQPPMLERDGEYWRLAPHVRRNSDFFAVFISDHLDEALNPGLFETLMRGPIRDAIAARTSLILNRRSDHHGNRRTREYFEAMHKSLRTYYGDDYGHEGDDDTLVSVANTCFPSVPHDLLLNGRDQFGQTLLHEAAARGELNLVRTLVESGADVRAQVRSDEHYSPEWGNTPVHYAARDGRLDVAEYLIQRGADVNARNDRGQTPLHRALAYPNLVELLLRHGAQVQIADGRGNTPLHWAAGDGQTESMDLLISRGANVRARNNVGSTPLHLAARYGNTDAATRLLTQGADINAKTNLGLVPLQIAVASRREHFVQMLITSGADLRARDQFGWTALHDAAHRGYLNIAELLIRQRADVNLPNAHGNTPLHLASRHAREGVVLALLATGVSVNIRNEAGATALHEAAQSGNQRVVRLLLDGGADRTVRDLNGMTALQIASRGGRAELAALLRAELAPGQSSPRAN